MLTDTTVNGQLHSCQVSKPYPVGHANHVWWFYERLHGLDGKCIFCVDLQNRWERSCTHDVTTLLEFRYRLMNHLVDQGLNVNLHIHDFYSLKPTSKSTFPNMLVELIRNGLTNFDTSCPLSLASIVIFEACIHTSRPDRRWAKIQLLLKLLNKLCASWKMTTKQIETEQTILRLAEDHLFPQSVLHPLIKKARLL